MPTIDPGSATKGDLAASDYGGPGEEELTPAALEEIIIGDGSIGVISSLIDSSFETDGFYSDPHPVVLYNTYDLNYLSSYEIGIAVETYPYVGGVLEDGNTTVDIYSSVSDFADPSIDFVTTLDVGASTTYHGSAGLGSDSGDGFEGNKLSVSYAAAEITGLTERFGNPSNSDSASIYSSTVEALTLEVSQTFRNKNYVFKHQRSKILRRRYYSSMSPVPPPPAVTVTSSAETFSTSAALGMQTWGTTTGGGY